MEKLYLILTHLRRHLPLTALRTYLPSRAGLLAVLFLLLFVGLVASRTSLLGGTLTTAVLPESSQQTAQAQVLPEEAAEVESYLAARVGLLHEAIDLTRGLVDVKKVRPLPPALIDSETLWLARCIYSETKRPEEQELVAWVVRNRVETGYRGKRNYQHVVLDPMQFSAFNPGTATRQFYSKLTPSTKGTGWQKALAIAHLVRHAPEQVRPFPVKTRHFYSEQSMVGRKHPAWATGKRPVVPGRAFQLEAHRFRFFEGIS